MQLLLRRVPARRAAASCCNTASVTARRTYNSARRQFFTTQPRRASPPPPSLAGFTSLASRRLISIAGADAPRFLQGIITSNILSLKNDPTSKGFYTGILNATGRVLHDVFIYPDTLRVGAAAADPSSARSGDAFIIEVDEAQVGNLMALIKRYKLRSKFKFRALAEDECAPWQVWGNESALSDQEGSSIVLPDTRAPGMGYRVISTNLAGPQVEADRSDEAAYRIRRYLLGVPEGQAEIQHAGQLPLEANMDVMGGIDFRKGCYVGQELTIRTKHRGVVRKRILPCAVYGEDEPMPQRLEYDPGASKVAAEDIPSQTKISVDGKKMGRLASNWVGGVGNVGLALCRLQVMTDLELPGETGDALFDPTKEHSMEWAIDGEEDGSKKAKVKAFVPDWLRTKLHEG